MAQKRKRISSITMGTLNHKVSGKEMKLSLNDPCGRHSQLSKATWALADRTCGYRHICVSVDDIEAACQRFEEQGVKWKKRLTDGRMKNIAFVLDPVCTAMLSSSFIITLTSQQGWILDRGCPERDSERGEEQGLKQMASQFGLLLRLCFTRHTRGTLSSRIRILSAMGNTRLSRRVYVEKLLQSSTRSSLEHGA